MDILQEIKLYESIVNDGNKRLCHKFRTSKYYGGIATVDVVGCYFDCAYCWVPDYKRKSNEISKNLKQFKLLDPFETSRILIDLATKNNLMNVRLSGGEPTLNHEHLLKTVELVTNKGLTFILETNGLNTTETLIENLSKFKDKIFVYYSIKGINREHFSELTNSVQSNWELQLQNISLYSHNGFKLGINTMMNYITKKDFIEFLEKLYSINHYLPICIDTKETSIFPHVSKRLKERGIINSNQIMNKNDYLKILEEEFNEQFKLRDNFLIKLGIMDFIDFEKINKNIA